MLTLPEDDPRIVEAIAAVRNGDLETLRRLLDEDPELATATIARRARRNAAQFLYPLLGAATDWPGHFPNVSATIATLVAAGADVNARCAGPHCEAPLHGAASSDDIEALDALLNAGADIEALGAVIAGTASVDELLERRRKGRTEPQVPGPPKIAIDNALSEAYTVIEMKCPDRVGLLYLITGTLAKLGLDIASARIATEIDKAFDTFYVHDRTGRKISTGAEMARCREGLERSLMQPL